MSDQERWPEVLASRFRQSPMHEYVVGVYAECRVVAPNQREAMLAARDAWEKHGVPSGFDDLHLSAVLRYGGEGKKWTSVVSTAHALKRLMHENETVHSQAENVMLREQCQFAMLQRAAGVKLAQRAAILLWRNRDMDAGAWADVRKALHALRDIDGVHMPEDYRDDV